MPSEAKLLNDQILGYVLQGIIDEDQANYVRRTPWKYRRTVLDKILNENG